MWIADGWKEYRLLDTSDGRRLERWGDYTLVRPDPQVLWQGVARHPLWQKADATYLRSGKGGGAWSANRLPQEWRVHYDLHGRPLTFVVKPMGFKHTGLFPEQAANWDWMAEKIKTAGRPIKVLNLFAYTGGASVACAACGASVCHVDASKGMVAQAKQNAQLSGLADAPIRYIVDDCSKFVEREKRRGNRYDAIIMDPPSYGRGPGGEMWKLEECIHAFLQQAVEVLTERPLFVLVNSYTTGLSPAAVAYLLRLAMQERFADKGSYHAGELGLPVEQTKGVLPCGASVRWEAED